jgi:hypothetical protein
LDDGCGGICAANFTEPGQLMTRLAVDPPTTELCCMVMPLVDEAAE